MEDAQANSAALSRSHGAHKRQQREDSQTVHLTSGSVVSEKKTFWIRCEPHNPRHSPIGTGGFSAYVGQRIRNNDIEQAWDAIIIHGDEEPDGTLAVRVLVSNPDWSNPLQIACIRSRPDDRDSQTALGCNLDHISISRVSP